MNCKSFDECIALTFEKYGPLGVHVQLYSASDRATPTPPGDWTSVTVVVTPVVEHPVPHTDTWYYGGIISHTTHPGAPLGVLPIDRERLVGACTAFEAIGDFPANASCDLFWPLVPGADEPAYTFSATQGGAHLVARVGAYSGKVLNRHPVMETAGAA